MAGAWIRTDEADDVAGSIRHALRVAPFGSDDPQAWKWVMLALHSALQGACVCHLTTTAAPVGALTKQNTREWLSFFEKQRTNHAAKPPAKTLLLNMPDLLKAVRKPHSAGDRSNGVGVAVSDGELAWLTRIHSEVRNKFVHFEPTGRSIDVSGVPDLARLIARILTEMLKMGWAFRHLDCEDLAALRRDIDELAALDWPMPNSDAA